MLSLSFSVLLVGWLDHRKNEICNFLPFTQYRKYCLWVSLAIFISAANVSIHLEETSHTYFQALQEQFHAAVVEEHLTVVRSLISNVPEGTPWELHHLITLQGWRNSFANVRARRKPNTCFISDITPDNFRGKKILLFAFNLFASGFLFLTIFVSLLCLSLQPSPLWQKILQHQLGFPMLGREAGLALQTISVSKSE